MDFDHAPIVHPRKWQSSCNKLRIRKKMHDTADFFAHTCNKLQFRHLLQGLADFESVVSAIGCDEIKTCSGILVPFS
jgi:hypothetical protein